MTDGSRKKAVDKNHLRDAYSDYIDVIRQDWRDLELATEDIWEIEDKKQLPH